MGLVSSFWESNKSASTERVVILTLMVSTTRHKKTLLLFLIFSVAFIFRVALIFHNKYPPSSDIGLHSGIINLILDEGKLPLWNPYHMGGEPLVTPPGFHFFVSLLILFTGMPLIFALLITAAFFSAFIVFPAYLISRKMWRSNSTGIIAAFFAAISALSIEMISWGGYTNIISLALIVIIFYLFIRDMEQPTLLNLLVGTLLFGSTLLTHTFTLFVLFPILIVYFAFLLIGKIRKLKEIKLKKQLRFFTISIVAGMLVVSPWILRVLNFYIGASGEILLGGVEENKNLILANRSIDSVVLVLVIVLILTFLILKASRKRYVDNVSLLLVAWFLVPLIMTQSYIFGVIIDYPRFIYFIEIPGILIISASLLYILRIAPIIIKKFSKIKTHRIKRIVPAIFTASFFIFIFLSPWSIYPGEAIKQTVNYYTTIRQPEAAGLGWIQNNTPESSVFVADHLYGWWLSGVGKRTTISAADLEFLLYQHEIEVAKSAELLLDTDYYIDNGLIQVRDDGVFLSRHNPEFSIKTWSGEPYSLFNIQDSGIELWYAMEGHENDFHQTLTLTDMRTVEAPKLMKGENSANLTVTFEDDLFIVKKTLTVWRGVRFAELFYDGEVKNSKIKLDNVSLPIYTREGDIKELSIQMFGFYDPNQKVCGQVIFKEDVPTHLTPQIYNTEGPPIQVINVQFSYPSEKHNINIKMLIGVFDAKDLSYPNEVEETYNKLAAAPLETVTLDPLVAWDYLEMIYEYNISYIACRDPSLYLKFSDVHFRRVFNSGNVAVFQVVK